LQFSPVKEGANWRRRDVVMQDQATQKTIRLKLWGDEADEDLEVNALYKTKNVLTAMWQGGVSVNSTPESTITKVCYSLVTICMTMIVVLLSGVPLASAI
jgi:hypothetical protein